MSESTLLWIFGIGFSVMGLCFTGTWILIGYAISQIGKLDEKLTDVDRRLCRLEGAFSSKDCCMIKDSRIQEKAE